MSQPGFPGRLPHERVLGDPAESYGNTTGHTVAPLVVQVTRPCIAGETVPCTVALESGSTHGEQPV
jgi:hypothetical protein